MLRTSTLSLLAMISLSSVSLADRPETWIGSDIHIRTRTAGGVDTILIQTVGTEVEIRHKVENQGQFQLLVRIPRVAVRKIYLNGDNDRDVFHNLSNVPSVIRGNGGNDILVGGSADDQLFGGEGEDYLSGNLGNDLLDPGDDLIEGEALAGGDFGDRVQSVCFKCRVYGQNFSVPQVFLDGTDTTPGQMKREPVTVTPAVLFTLLSQLRNL